MGFQPYDNRMYKFKRNSNIRILYDTMLELENIEHINSIHEIGFIPTTLKQLHIKSELTIMEVRTSIKNLIANNIITLHEKGNIYKKTPSIFYFNEIIERKVTQRVNTEKQHRENKNKRISIKGLRHCKILTLTQRVNTEEQHTYKRLSLKDNYLKDKGIEKKQKNDLTFRENLELFAHGGIYKDDTYFDAMNELEK